MTDPETLLQHAAFLRGLARGLLGDPARAEDVLQQTWLAAYEKGPRQPAKLRAWLATTLRNFVRMTQRGEARRARREERTVRREAVASTAEIAGRTELQRRVAEAVHALDEPYRTTIVLRYLDEHSAAEIARQQGVPVKTVQTRLRRGLERLRARLDESYGGDRRSWAILLLPLAFPSSATAAGGTAATATIWIALMKPKFVLPLLVILGAGSFLLSREARGRDATEFAGRGRPDAPNVARDEPAPPAETGEKPNVVPGATLLRGILQDQDGLRVANATVTPGRWHDNDRWVPTARGVRSDSEGAFTVSVGGRGTGVRIVHPDYVPQRAWLNPAQPRVITLRNGVSMHLVVVSPDRTPVPGANLRVSLHERASGGMWSIEEIATLSTDAAGRAAVRRVPKGRIFVVVNHADYPERVVTFQVEAKIDETIVLKIGGTITGRVLDQRGHPVPGARVRAVEQEQETIADGAGRYALEGLPPGWADLVADAEGFGATRFGGIHGWREPTPVPVRDRTTTRGIDIVLPDATWLSGRVIDEEGDPVAGLGYSVYAGGAIEGKTDVDGRFRVPLGIAGRETAVLYFESRERWHVEGMAKISLREGEDRNLGDLKAMTLAHLSGRVVDERGRPVPEGRAATAFNVVSIRNGRFEMAVRPGSKQLRVDGELDGVRVFAQEAFNVGPGERRDDLKLVVHVSHIIAGRLVTPDGKAKGHVWVMAVPQGNTEPFPRMLHASAFAAADGTFQLAVPTEGTYRVGLFEAASRRGFARLADDPAPVRVTPGGPPITLVQPRDAVVSGQALSARDRRPLRPYEARLVRYRDGLPWATYIITVDDPEGRFRFDDAEGGHDYAVEIAAKGHGLFRSDVFHLARGETREIEPVFLRAAGSVRGRVLDHDGRPVAFARVSLLGPRLETNVDRRLTDLDGRFGAIPFAPGEHTVVAFVPSRPLGLARFRIREGARTDVEVTLPPPAPVTIVVEDAQGHPVPDIPVSFSMEEIEPLTSEHMFRLYLDGHPGQGYRTDAGGKLRIRFLPPGEVEIRVGEIRQRTTLVAGADNEVVVKLAR